MPDYQRGKIYKLWSPSNNLIYYGSNIETLSSRLSKHIYSYKNYNEDNTKKYYSSYLVLDCEDYKIELVEEYACNNKSQLCKKEGEYIKNNECVNKCVAGRTKQEYRIDNIDRLKECRKQNNIKNVVKIKEQTKQYRINNANKLKEYEQLRSQTEERKEQHNKAVKKYYLANIDKIRERQKQYRLRKKAENTN
jgi:hypothetical protein